MIPLWEQCDLLDVPLPMFGFLVASCDGGCHSWAPGGMTWIMTYAGTGWGDYYGPTPPEYDPLFICFDCERREREAEERMDRLLEQEAEEEERRYLAERIQEEEAQARG